MATLNVTPGSTTKLNVLGLISPAPGRLVGVPTWSSSDTTKVRVKPARDGITCDVISLGPTGSATITVSAQGASVLTGTVTIAVAAVGLATSVVIGAAGPPRAYP